MDTAEAKEVLAQYYLEQMASTNCFESPSAAREYLRTFSPVCRRLSRCWWLVSRESISMRQNS